MNQLNQTKTSSVLNDAIDLSIAAANQLHLSDAELMALVISHLHPSDAAVNNLTGESVTRDSLNRVKFNSLAGP